MQLQPMLLGWRFQISYLIVICKIRFCSLSFTILHLQSGPQRRKITHNVNTHNYVYLDLALIFLLFRLSLRIRFFLHCKYKTKNYMFFFSQDLERGDVSCLTFTTLSCLHVNSPISPHRHELSSENATRISVNYQ